MIRKFETKDTERVMQIWLEANMEAHDFVPDEYWLSQYESVQKQLLQADIKKYRSMGIGKGLLECIKKNYPAFSLNVYQKNRRAVEYRGQNIF